MRIAKCSLVLLLGALALYKPGDNKRHISPEMREQLVNEEGCALCTYEDTVSVKTIGVGSTRDINGNPIIEGARLTEEEIAELFLRDLSQDEKCLNDKLNGQEMPQSVYDAIGSVVHNIGCSGVSSNRRTKGHTRLRNAALKGNWMLVCSHVTDYKYAGGKISPAILSRRSREQEICMRDLESDDVGDDKESSK